LGRVTTLVVDAAGVLTENKSSVSYIMIDKEIREATSTLPEGEPTFNALLRACVLGCNAFFQVPDGVNKTKLNIDHLDIEEWDNTSGALLRFYEKNPTLGMKRRDDAFCSEIVRRATHHRPPTRHAQPHLSAYTSNGVFLYLPTTHRCGMRGKRWPMT
jgi:hypothetical protein